MRDSFFSARNQIDAYLERFDPPATIAAALIEAGVRHLCRREGSYAAAVRIQRLADICAGVEVYSLEHWRQETQRPTRLKVMRKFVAGIASDPIVTLYVGMVFGLWTGGWWQ